MKEKLFTESKMTGIYVVDFCLGALSMPYVFNAVINKIGGEFYIPGIQIDDNASILVSLVFVCYWGVRARRIWIETNTEHRQKEEELRRNRFETDRLIDEHKKKMDS